MLRVFSDGLVATLHNTVGGTDRAETNEASMLVLERACPSKAGLGKSLSLKSSSESRETAKNSRTIPVC